MKISRFLLPIIIAIGFTIYLSLFTVKEINQAIVLQFGDPKKIIAICFDLSSDNNVARLCVPKTLLNLELIIVANLDLATLSSPTET